MREHFKTPFSLKIVFAILLSFTVTKKKCNSVNYSNGSFYNNALDEDIHSSKFYSWKQNLWLRNFLVS